MGQTSDPSGYVYVITHPHFPGWVKVGQTNDPRRRLSSYNTGDPDRGYHLYVAAPTLGRRHAEWLAHKTLRRLGYAKKGEWFDAPPAKAESVVRRAAAQADEEFDPRS
ncbi:GIY-YIG nuclease family protein [Devosia enhydra]|uniref:GIY-YIG nuclease family protein n=1 Tax=Devosia enhydra TaxID=665118 RepID=UPI0009319E73|nr:GIY-YIG nuclease family protein [Devosia enhydra]